MHPFFLLKLLQRLVGLAGGRVHQVLGEPGRPAPSMALRARRSRGCRAASGRRRRSAREIPLITSPSPGVLTVAASGVGEYAGPEFRCCALRAAIAGMRAGWVHGMGPGGRGACALRPRCGCPNRRAAGELGSCRGPPRLGSGSSSGSGSGVGAPELRAGGDVARIGEMQGASAASRVPSPGAGVSGRLYLEKAHPFGVRRRFTWINNSADLYFHARAGPSSFGQARGTHGV